VTFSLTTLLETIRANWLENVAVAFGMVSVYLSTREKIASWPTAIVNVGIFFFVFWKARLYADAGLQIVYLVLSIYGWYEWLYGGAQHTRLRVTRTSAQQWVVMTLLAASFAGGLGWFLSRHTDSPVPYLDASLTAFSLMAQWMMTRKQLENWGVWIAVNLVYVPVLVVRGLSLTAVQYAVFIVLAAMGLRDWRRSLRDDGALAGQAA
jgi:nicotinamide mononucleotide transporter